MSLLDRLRNKRGQTIVLFAVLLPILVGMTGLVVDAGVAYVHKSRLQNAVDGAIVIWTTTPWTLPANQALNVGPEITYALVKLATPRATGSHLLIAADLVDPLALRG